MEREDKTIQSERDHDKPFVEWVNGDDGDYPEGIYVEAVFAGHMHQNIGFGKSPPYKITSANMDDPETFNSLSATIPFYWNTVCIETTTATKNYG